LKTLALLVLPNKVAVRIFKDLDDKALETDVFRFAETGEVKGKSMFCNE
jgi:hypothetical protein